MNNLKNNHFVIGIIIAAIICFLDQLSKDIVFSYLKEMPGYHVEVTSFFNLVVVQNYGVSFGMFNNLTNGALILSFIALSITIGMLFWLKNSKEWHITVSVSLIIGGAIGNTIDRLRFGAVSDFLDFHVGQYHWPAFNVADCAVVIGVGIILLDSFMEKNTDGKNEKNN
ncbi:signal peptidase II [Rickettsiales bacterium]|nr:signal peptidase II [Rickettsiales bacterium]